MFAASNKVLWSSHETLCSLLYSGVDRAAVNHMDSGKQGPWVLSIWKFSASRNKQNLSNVSQP